MVFMRYNLKFDVQLLNGRKFTYKLDQKTEEPKEIDWDEIKEQCYKAKSYTEMAETYKRLLEPFGVTVQFRKKFYSVEIELVKIKGLKQKKLYIPPCFNYFKYSIQSSGRVEAWATGLKFEEVEYDNRIDKRVQLSGIFVNLKQRRLMVHITHPELIDNMDYMFAYCKQLEKVIFTDIYKLRKSNAIDIQGMFCNCYKLKNIQGLEYLNTSELSCIDLLFYGCKSLKDISFMKNWDASKIKGMDRTFCGCESLEDISVLKNFKVQYLLTTSRMFDGCISLKDISPLKDFCISSINQIDGMFRGCIQLEDISPLKDWNAKGIYMMGGIFKDCTNLKSVKPLEGWDVSNIRQLNEMLENCINVCDADVLEPWVEKLINGIYCKDAFLNTGSAVNQNRHPSWYKEGQDYLK